MNGSDRVEIIWPDYAIRNQWLQVTVNANSNTGLASADIFYFGNLVGDTGDQAANATSAVVDANDVQTIRLANRLPQEIASWVDLNRDGLTTGTDVAIAKANLSQTLVMVAPPLPPAAVRAVVAKTLTGIAQPTSILLRLPLSLWMTAHSSRHSLFQTHELLLPR